jgi:hypothetical protein
MANKAQGVVVGKDFGVRAPYFTAASEISTVTMTTKTTIVPANEVARRVARDALGIQIYPGTEVMTDGILHF